MQNSMMLFSFLVFDWKYPFWANLVQKVKIISWSWNSVPRLILICRIQWCCSFSCFWVEIPFLGKFCPKNQNCHFKVSFLRWNLVPTLIRTCRIQWWCSFFFGFWVEIPFLGKFGPKNLNCHFKVKFGTYTNSNMQNSMVMLIFLVFEWKYPFWANLVQNIEIITLS